MLQSGQGPGSFVSWFPHPWGIDLIHMAPDGPLFHLDSTQGRIMTKGSRRKLYSPLLLSLVGRSLVPGTHRDQGGWERESPLCTARRPVRSRECCHCETEVSNPPPRYPFLGRLSGQRPCERGEERRGQGGGPGACPTREEWGWFELPLCTSPCPLLLLLLLPPAAPLGDVSEFLLLIGSE